MLVSFLAECWKRRGRRIVRRDQIQLMGVMFACTVGTVHAQYPEIFCLVVGLPLNAKTNQWLGAPLLPLIH